MAGPRVGAATSASRIVQSARLPPVLIPFSDLFARHQLTVTGVIHAGAHIGQEAPAYKAAGIDHVLWIEANDRLLRALNKVAGAHGHHVAHACLGATTGEAVTFHVADSTDGSNHGQSSSVLPLGTHQVAHPEVTYKSEVSMTTTSLDDVVTDAWPLEWGAPNMLNMDLQGYELHCLRGADRVLSYLDVIYTEVNEDELYEGCVLLPDLVAYLAARGFELAEKRLAGAQTRDCADGGRWVGWGDAVFLRTGRD